MKKVSVLGMVVCFFIVCCLSLSEAANIKKLIIGKWIENNRNSLELVEDGTAIIVEEGKSAAGNFKFLPDGRLKIDLGGFWGSKVFEVSIDKEGRLNLKEPNGEVTKYLTEKAYKMQLDEGALKSKRSDGNYVVKVNSTVITREDLKREFASQPEWAQEMFRTEKGIFKIVEELVKKHMLYQEAKRKGLDKDPAYQKKVADSQGLILISSLLEKEIEDKAKVTDKDVKDFYKKNKADFTEKGGKVIAFEKIKEMITQRMTAQKQKEVFDSYVETLRKAYPQISPSTFTQIDINKELEALPDFSRKAFEGEEGRAKLIEEMIKKEILYQEAKRKGLDKNPAFVKKVADSQKLILISSLLEKEIEDKAKVTDKDVKDFYEKNKADFTEKGGKVIAFEKIKEMLTQRMTAQKQKEVFDSYIENLKKSYVIEINEKAVKAFQKSLVKK